MTIAEAQATSEQPTGPLLNVVRSGSGPVVVLLHGVAGSLKVWDKVIPALEADFTVVRIDLLGYGASPKPRSPYTTTVHIDAVQRSLDSAGVTRPFTLIGLSMGATLALEYAYRWPSEVREIVVIGYPHFSSEADARRELAKLLVNRLMFRHRLIAAALVPMLLQLARRVAPMTKRQFTIYTRSMAADALKVRYLAYRRTLMNCMVRHPLAEALRGTAEKRRLFIHGTHDEWSSAEHVGQVVSEFPNSEFRLLPGPHNLVVVAPDEVLPVIFGWLTTAGPVGG